MTPQATPPRLTSGPAAHEDGAPRRHCHLRAVFPLVLLLAVSCRPACASETCRFAGDTDHHGHAEIVTTAATTADGDTHLDVQIVFTAATWPWWHIHYSVEEISDYHRGVLRHLATNTRYAVDTHIVRQQWDIFDRTAAGLQARRIQGKSLADFTRQHPGFVQHWPPDAFGAPWLADVAAASADRRPDLDLAGASADLRTPFALLFYWVRFLPPGGTTMPVFLPGFKADQMVTISARQAAPAPAWHADLITDWLSQRPPSGATALLSADGHLRDVRFDLYGSAGSAHGEFAALGCR